MARNATALRALGYYGGKSPHGGRALAKWISECIGPTPQGWSYFEPFAGMAGVLLSRPPAQIEIANDANGWLVAWWRAVRDFPDQFGRLIEATPYSRAEYAEAGRRIAGEPSGDPLRDALTAHVVIEQSRMHGPAPTGWSRRLQARGGNRKPVQLEQGCALALLEDTAKIKRAVIYCDPPYLSADTSPYGAEHGAADFDRNRFMALLQEQRGRVAVSGYGDDWSALGWRRETLDTVTLISGKRADRVEALWLNFDAPPVAGFFE